MIDSNLTSRVHSILTGNVSWPSATITRTTLGVGRRRWMDLALAALVGVPACSSRDEGSNPAEHGQTSGVYTIAITASSVPGLGPCPDLGAVGLVTTAEDGGTSYALYSCSKHGNRLQWDPIACTSVNA